MTVSCHSEPLCFDRKIFCALGSYNLVCAVQVEHIDSLLTHLVLEDFACGVHREFVDEGDIARHQETL